jgi:hypothetical protein
VKQTPSVQHPTLNAEASIVGRSALGVGYLFPLTCYQWQATRLPYNLKSKLH